MLINPYVFGMMWTPAQITTALWLDADDSSTITSSGGLVSQINDKSGNGRNFTASSTARPTLTSNGLNSKNVLTFNGSQWLTSVNAASTWSFMHNATGCAIIAAVKAGITTNPDTICAILGNGGTTSANVGMSLIYDDRSSVSRNNAFLSTVFKGVLGAAVSINLANDVWAPNQFAIIANKLDNSNATPSMRNIGRLNGGSDIANNIDSSSSVASDPTFVLQIGAAGNNSLPAIMTLSELIIVSGIASNTTIQRTEGYLAWKWGLTANLPSGHPYKSFAPLI